MNCSCGMQTLHLLPTVRLCRIPNTLSSSKSSNASFSSLSFFTTYSKYSNISRDIRRPQFRGKFFPKSSLMDLPLLPFPLDEVLVPSECKTLHLYEARYLALLEESLGGKKLFVHFVLEPVFTCSNSVEASFAARYGCLVLIEDVEKLDIGALVSIRGMGRVNIIKFLQMEPYLRGVVVALKDDEPDCLSKTTSVVKKLKDALHNLHSLEIKLKDSKDEPLQTRVKSSVSWAEKETVSDCDQAFIPVLAERMSFAALQPVSGSTNSELLNLQKEKKRAMDLKDTHKRLANSLELVNQNIAMVAAKLAIQSLGI